MYDILWKLWKEKPPKICPRSYPIENIHFPTSFHTLYPPIPHPPNTLIIQQNSSQSIPNYRPHSPQSVEKSPRGKEKRGEKPKNSAINPGKTPQKGENKWKTSHTKRPLPAPHFSQPFSNLSSTFSHNFSTGIWKSPEPSKIIPMLIGRFYEFVSMETTKVVIERQCTARCLQRVAPRILEVCTH